MDGTEPRSRGGFGDLTSLPWPGLLTCLPENQSSISENIKQLQQCSKKKLKVLIPKGKDKIPSKDKENYVKCYICDKLFRVFDSNRIVTHIIFLRSNGTSCK